MESVDIQILNFNYKRFFSCVAAADLSTSFKQADPSNLAVYMNQIIRPGVARNYKNVEELNRISARLKEQMRLFGIPCNYQTYEVYGKIIEMSCAISMLAAQIK